MLRAPINPGKTTGVEGSTITRVTGSTMKAPEEAARDFW